MRPMSQGFRTIALLGRRDDPGVVETVSALYGFLRRRGVSMVSKESLWLDATAAEVAAEAAGPEPSDLPALRSCDLAIVVGGDGSLLHSARQLADNDIPVLGVNLGRLGFLVDVSPSVAERVIAEVLDGQYTLEERFLLSAQCHRNGGLADADAALNDVVLKSGESAHMLEFDLLVDGEYVYNQHADGLIVATPTGSTAYALSGGGPIMHPGLNAMALVPMFPHTLSNRPLMIGGDSEVEIQVSAAGGHAVLNCDGRRSMRLEFEDRIIIRKQARHLTMVHPLQHNFYAACRDKLGWRGRTRSVLPSRGSA